MDFAKTFTDAMGRLWTVDITVGTLPRLKSVAGIVLDDLVPKKLSTGDAALMPLAEFLSDPVAILQSVYAICKPQIDKLDLTFDTFAEGFEGADSVRAVEDMGKALMQAIADFFLKSAPIKSPMRAALVKRVLSMGQKLTTVEANRSEKVFDRIENRMDKIISEPISEAKIDAAMDEAFSKFAGSTPALLESTRAN